MAISPVVLTSKQAAADIEFLAKRAQMAGTFSDDRNRDCGLSSNSLISLAYGVGSLEMPSDWYDYAACERAANNLPVHRRTTIIDEALARQKAHVTLRYPKGEGHYREAMPKDLVNK